MCYQCICPSPDIGNSEFWTFWLLDPIDFAGGFLDLSTSNDGGVCSGSGVGLLACDGNKLDQKVHIWSHHPSSRVCLMDPFSTLFFFRLFVVFVVLFLFFVIKTF